jgi:hypothetical protein
MTRRLVGESAGIGGATALATAKRMGLSVVTSVGQPAGVGRFSVVAGDEPTRVVRRLVGAEVGSLRARSGTGGRPPTGRGPVFGVIQVEHGGDVVRAAVVALHKRHTVVHRIPA